VPEAADNPTEGDGALVRAEEVTPDAVLPALAEPRALARPAPPPLPMVVAAGTVGFVAGVAAWMLVRVLRRPRHSPSVRKLRKRRQKGMDIAATRSFLVDVHLLRDR
jgi:hypothetical protein